MTGKLLAQRKVDWQNVDGSNIFVPKIFDKGLAGAGNAGELAMVILQVMLMAVGAVAVFFLIVGGYRYIMAHGNEEQAEAAKKTIYHALIGLAVVILSFVIVMLVSKILITGKIN